MRRALILAYDFPPYNSIGGQRPYSWFKFLKEFEWEPIIVTRHWDENIQSPVDYVKPSKNQEETYTKGQEGIVIRALFRPNLRDKMLIKFGFKKFSLFRKTLTFLYQLSEFFSPVLDNKINIYKSADGYLQQNNVDLIIATGEPFVLFKYAKQLSRKHNTPWIADYRDGWTTNYNRSKFEKWF